MDMDPSKMKVADLRQELQTRGLDTKGVKAVLVRRLTDALNKENEQKGIPNKTFADTSIADTSTEDLDSSQTESEMKSEGESEIPSESNASSKPKEAEDGSPQKTSANEGNKDTQPSPAKEKVSKPSPAKAEGNAAKAAGQEADKSSGDSQEKSNQSAESTPMETDADNEVAEEKDAADDSVKTENENKVETTEGKGEKRKRGDTSPERSQRRRSKSPVVREDEPEIDESKVLLSWVDSDLHLKVDKEKLLSAKPCNEGAFGYIWAGARATHGVSSGKVYYEIKITEEMKWEDLSKIYENRNRDPYRYDARKNKGDYKKKNKDHNADNAEKANKEKNQSEKVVESKSGEVNENSQEPSEKDSSETKTDAAAASEEKPAEATVDSSGDKIPTDAVDNKPTDAADKKTVDPADTKTADDKATAETKMEVDSESTPATTANEESANGDVKKEDNESAEKEAETTAEPKPEPKPIASHLLRVGWSLPSCNLQLGEDDHSYGYESSGKFVSGKNFVEFGKAFGVNDVVGVFLDIGTDNTKIMFRVNEEEPKEAVSVPNSELPENFAFFPHVLSRNFAFEVNFGDKEEPFVAPPSSLSDFIFISKTEGLVPGPTRIAARGDCEVLLMFGLPGAGKTYWVKNHVQSNLDKRYTLIGNTYLLEKMTVEGTPLKQNYKGRWNILVDMLQKCLNHMLQVAATRRRNYIIDQTNVFPSAQRRKLRPFQGFKRNAVAVVVSDEEQAKRHAAQESQDEKDMPDSALLELKANMTLPEKNDWIEEVIFSDLQEEEAKEQVKKFNTEGRDAGFGPGRRPREDRKKYYNSKKFDRGPRDRNFRGYDRGRQGWGGGRPYGNWQRDRNDRGYSGNWKSRDNDRDGRYQGGYNRNQGGGNRQPWRSGGGGGWQGQGNWNTQQWGGQGSWGGGWSGGQGGSQGSQWKHGNSGGGSGSYGSGNGGNSNWNYYGQYGQNWNNSGSQARRN